MYWLLTKIVKLRLIDRIENEIYSTIYKLIDWKLL